MAGNEKVLKHDHPAPKKTDVDAVSGGSPIASNEDKAKAAELSRVLISYPIAPEWAAVGGAFVPKKPIVEAIPGQPVVTPVKNGPTLQKFSTDAYTQARKSEGGWENLARFLGSVIEYQPYAFALSDAIRSQQADAPHLVKLRGTVSWFCGHGDVKIAVTHLAGEHAGLSQLGKRWLAVDPEFLKELVDYCRGGAYADGYHEIFAKRPGFGIDVEAAKKLGDARRASSEALLRLLKNAGVDASAIGAGGAPLSEDEQKKKDEERKKLEAEHNAEYEAVRKRILAVVDGSSKDHKLNSGEMLKLQTLIAGKPDWLRDRLYGDTELQHHLTGALSPQQLKSVTHSLDPIDRLYDGCVASKGTEVKGKPYELIREYLKGHPGDGGVPARQRVMQHTRLLNEFVSRLGTEEYNLVVRLVCTGSEEPDEIEQMHVAADLGQADRVCQIILKYGSTDKFKAAQADSLLREKVAKINKEVMVDGLPMKPWELMLRAWGQNPFSTVDPLTGSREQYVNPSAAPQDTLPLNQKELRTIQEQLYDPVVSRLCDELDDRITYDDVVNSYFEKYNLTKSRSDMVALLQRADFKPGERFLELCNAKTGGKAHKYLKAGCDEWLVQKGEKAWGLRPEDAGRGTMEGKMQRGPEDIKSGQGKMSVEQALNSMQIGGRLGADFIGAACGKMNSELNEENEWFNDGADAGDMVKIWDNFVAGLETKWDVDASLTCIGRIRSATVRPKLEPIELFCNGFVPKGGDFVAKVNKTLGAKRLFIVLQHIPINPAQIAARANQLSDKTDLDNPAVKADVQLTEYSSKAKELFQKLSKIHVGSSPSDLNAVRDFLGECQKLGPMTKAAESFGTPGVQYGVKGQVGGPSAPTAAIGSPRSFKDLYRRDFGIEPDRHVIEIARSLVRSGKDAPTVAAALGIMPPSAIGEAVKPPSEKLELTTETELIIPGFTIEMAKERAAKIWKVLHTTGHIQHIRKEMDGDSGEGGAHPEQQRLIHIAFRQLSGGIDLQFFIQQALAQYEDQKKSDVSRAMNHGHSSGPVPMQVGGGGTAEGKAAAGGKSEEIHVRGEKGNMYETLGVLQHGTVDIKSKIRSILYSDNINQLYFVLEDATEAEKDAIFKDGELMRRIRSLCDDEWEWTRVNKTLLNAADLADMLFARSHGDQGFWESTFGGTDEEGMRKDIKRYFERRRKQIRAQVEGGIPEELRPQNAELIAKRIDAQLRMESAKVAAHPTIRAIIEDELSGDELADIQGRAANMGEDKAVSYMTAGNGGVFYDSGKLMDKIRAMPPAERKKARVDPEFMRRLNQLMITPEKKRDAMSALFSDVDVGQDDNLAVLDKSTRGVEETGPTGQQPGTHPMVQHQQQAADGLKAIEALAHLSPDEYKKLQANPTMRAQVLASLRGDQLELAQQILSFHMKEPSKTAKPVAPGQMDEAEQIRIEYLKHNSASRIRYACQERGFDILLREAISVFGAKLKPKLAAPPDTTSEGPAPAPDPTVKDAKPLEKKKDVAHEMEQKFRAEIWKDVAATVKEFAKQSESKVGGKNLTDAKIVELVNGAVMALADPSEFRIAENTGRYNDDEKGIESTLRGVQPMALVESWSTVKGKEPGGHPNMVDTYGSYVQTKKAAK